MNTTGTYQGNFKVPPKSGIGCWNLLNMNGFLSGRSPAVALKSKGLKRVASTGLQKKEGPAVALKSKGLKLESRRGVDDFLRPAVALKSKGLKRLPQTESTQ